MRRQKSFDKEKGERYSKDHDKRLEKLLGGKV